LDAEPAPQVSPGSSPEENNPSPSDGPDGASAAPASAGPTADAEAGPSAQPQGDAAFLPAFPDDPSSAPVDKWGAFAQKDVGQPVVTRDGQSGVLRAVGQGKSAIATADGKLVAVDNGDIRPAAGKAGSDRPSPAQASPDAEELPATEAPPDSGGSSRRPPRSQDAAPGSAPPPQKLFPALQPIIDEYHTKIAPLEKEIEVAEKKYEEAHAKGDFNTWSGDYKRFIGLLDERSAAMERMASASPVVLGLPGADRGSLPVVGDIPASIQKAANSGRQIVENYIHKDLLPRSEFLEKEEGTPTRHTDDARVHLGPSDDEIRAIHEIVHGIEKQFPDVLDKSREFLAKRAEGRASVPLHEIDPLRDYEPNKIGFEDRWVELGGSPYSGRDYSRTGNPYDAPATELLTEGLTRLHENPALFAATDPEYFSFVVNTLRKK
jgi:hypothetical protein